MGFHIPPLCPWLGDKPAIFLDIWNQVSECPSQTFAENMTGSTTSATRTPELPRPCMTWPLDYSSSFSKSVVKLNMQFL